MTPTQFVRRLRRLDNTKRTAKRELLIATDGEQKLIDDAGDLLPFTHAGRTYEPWTTRNGRRYVRVTVIK